jgi:prepilin-type N-terminal cleavage/methylation domain-containing protein
MEERGMVTRSTGSQFPRRVGEKGLTLIELTVSLAILAIIAGALAAAFSVGLHVTAQGGSEDRLAGAHDLSSLEQVLGRDGSRAACIQISDDHTYGHSTCSSAVNVLGCATANSLCFAWPQFDGAWTCHVAVYSPINDTPSGRLSDVVTRKEFVGASPISTIQETVDKVIVTIESLNAVPVPDGNSYYSWLRSLQLRIQATGMPAKSVGTLVPRSFSTFTQALSLHPVATDPGGAVPASEGSSPC